MMSTIPFDLKNIKEEEVDAEILRIGIIAELDAINLYKQMASQTKSEDLKKILMDIAKEEKTHVGEFQALLLKRDHEQAEELKAGEKEVSEKI